MNGKLPHTCTIPHIHIETQRIYSFHVRRLMFHTFQLRRNRCHHLKMLLQSGLPTHTTINSFYSFFIVFWQFWANTLFTYENMWRVHFFCGFVVLLDKTIRYWRIQTKTHTNSLEIINLYTKVYSYYMCVCVY